MKTRARFLYSIFLGATLLLFQNCAEQSKMQPPDDEGPDILALRISPKTPTVPVGAKLTFTSSGGTNPKTFSIVSGGGSIGSTDGVFTAPAVTGATVVKVRDSKGLEDQTTVTITGAGALAATFSPNPVRIGDLVTITASGGTSPYTYKKIVGEGILTGNKYQAPVTATGDQAYILVTDKVGAVVTVPIVVPKPSQKVFLANQLFTVPTRVTTLHVKAWGGGGGGGGNDSSALGGAGGGGAYAYKVLNVTPGQLLGIYVGGPGFGGKSDADKSGVGLGGYPGGARGGYSRLGSGAGGGGGGWSGVLNGTTPLLVAAGGGGGGGAGYRSADSCGSGGGGGQDGFGATYSNPACGFGGEAAAMTGDDGSFGRDAAVQSGGGGGGGGGLKGGKGGGVVTSGVYSGGGGGGGSSWGTVVAPGQRRTPGHASDPDRATAGLGGAPANMGNAGRVILYW